MNKVELQGLKWISKYTGYLETSITFRNNTSPDFITPDGKGFEIKRKWQGRYITIYPRQWQSLLSHPDCVILVFANLSEPEAIIPMTTLPFNAKTWGRYHILSYETNLGGIPRKEYLALIKAQKGKGERCFTRDRMQELLHPEQHKAMRRRRRYRAKLRQQ